MKYVLFCFLLVMCLFSCQPMKRVQEQGDKLVSEYKALPDYESLPVRELSWQQALLLMQKNNLELRQAYNNLSEARYQEKKIWREWIPSLNFGQYYNRKLFPGGNGGIPNDSQLSYNVIFNFPSLMELPMRKYTTSLAVFKAQKDIELKQKELTAQLYHLFLLSDFRDRKRRLEQGEKESEKGLTKPDTDAAERKDWLELSRLINDNSARWRLNGADVPRVSLEDYREALQAPSELSIVQMALQVEASRLQKLGILLQFWPQIHVDFYSPSLFNSSGGTLNGFMKTGKDTRVNMNMFIVMDTQGQNIQAYRTAKENHELLLKELRQKMWEYKEKTAALMNSWKQYESWRKAMTAYLQFRAEQGAETPQEVVQMHADSMQLQRELGEQELANMERICSLVQEYGFPSTQNQRKGRVSFGTAPTD